MFLYFLRLDSASYCTESHAAQMNISCKAPHPSGVKGELTAGERKNHWYIGCSGLSTSACPNQIQNTEVTQHLSLPVDVCHHSVIVLRHLCPCEEVGSVAWLSKPLLSPVDGCSSLVLEPKPRDRFTLWTQQFDDGTSYENSTSALSLYYKMVGSTWRQCITTPSYPLLYCPISAFCNNCLVIYSVATVGLYTVLAYIEIQNITTTPR